MAVTVHYTDPVSFDTLSSHLIHLIHLIHFHLTPTRQSSFAIWCSTSCTPNSLDQPHLLPATEPMSVHIAYLISIPSQPLGRGLHKNAWSLLELEKQVSVKTMQDHAPG